MTRCMYTLVSATKINDKNVLSTTLLTISVLGCLRMMRLIRPDLMLRRDSPVRSSRVGITGGHGHLDVLFYSD